MLWCLILWYEEYWVDRTELEAVTYNTLWMGECVLGKMQNGCIELGINSFNYAKKHMGGE